MVQTEEEEEVLSVHTTVIDYYSHALRRLLSFAFFLHLSPARIVDVFLDLGPYLRRFFPALSVRFRLDRVRALKLFFVMQTLQVVLSNVFAFRRVLRRRHALLCFRCCRLMMMMMMQCVFVEKKKSGVSPIVSRMRVSSPSRRRGGKKVPRRKRRSKKRRRKIVSRTRKQLSLPSSLFRARGVPRRRRRKQKDTLSEEKKPPSPKKR